MVLGFPLTFGGVHYGLTEKPLGSVAALAGWPCWASVSSR
jgi:hypothetical protein